MTGTDGALDRDLKEIKVRIPVQYHIQLHSMKILKGQPIHDTVREALGVYLDKFFQQQAPPPQQQQQPKRE